MATHILTPSRAAHGLLTAGGTDILHAVVHTRPVPTRAPASLADSVSVVRDIHGRLVDWELTPATRQAADRSLIDGFHEWRSTFAYERVLGERCLAQSFVSWTSAHTSTPSLDVLARPTASLDPSAAIRVRWQVERARDAYTKSKDTALGLFADADAHSPIRGFLAADPSTIVISSREVVVTAGGGGLQARWLQTGDISTLTGWHLESSGLTLVTPEGDVAVSSATATETIVALGHGHADVVVRRIPVGRLFAPLTSALTDASTLAMTCRTGMSLYSGWRTGSRH